MSPLKCPPHHLLPISITLKVSPGAAGPGEAICGVKDEIWCMSHPVLQGSLNRDAGVVSLQEAASALAQRVGKGKPHVMMVEKKELDSSSFFVFGKAERIEWCLTEIK